MQCQISLFLEVHQTFQPAAPPHVTGSSLTVSLLATLSEPQSQSCLQRDQEIAHSSVPSLIEMELPFIKHQGLHSLLTLSHKILSTTLGHTRVLQIRKLSFKGSSLVKDTQLKCEPSSISL